MVRSSLDSIIRNPKLLQAPQNLSETASAVSLSGDMNESAWLEVISRMDEVYAELLDSQVILEQQHEAVKDAQNFIDNVLSAMSDVLIVCDNHNKILDANQAFERLVGRQLNELKCCSLNDFFEGDQAKQAVQFAHQIRHSALMDCELDLITADGQPAPLSLNGAPRFNAKRRYIGYVLTGRPLGELKRAYTELNEAHERLKTTQRKLVQSEKLASLGRLIAGVAHELNNPISFVYGNIHALNQYISRIKRYLAIIHSNSSKDVCEQARNDLRIDHIIADLDNLIEGTQEGAERVSNIVESLSRFSSPSEQHKTEFDLSRLIRTAQHWVARATKAEPVLKLDLPEQCFIVNREGYLQQILINLIQNAYDAVEDQVEPTLLLRITRSDHWIEVEVQDNGKGIDESDLLRIFDPFFTRKDVGKGTGLGLYISYGLVTEQCDGQLEINNHPSGGVSAIVRLPSNVEITHEPA